jgi:uncharacterized OsmC-like protein
MSGDFEVVVGAGSLASADLGAVRFPHRWTADGVTVLTEFTGAHLLHVSVAACVLNDTYREAAAAGVALDGVLVRARGRFDTDTWRSTGIDYAVELDTGAAPEERQRLLDAVDAVAEIPRAIRSGAPVHRRTRPAQ